MTSFLHPSMLLSTLIAAWLFASQPVSAGDVPGDPDSMPGWLGTSYRSPLKKPAQAVERAALDYKRVVRLHAWKPRAFLYRGFLSGAECDHVMALATPHLERSEVADSTAGGGEVSQVRTSFGMFVEKGEDDVIKAIEERIAKWTFLPVANQEALQVLRYTKGQQYEAHHDYFDDPESRQQGGHRYATVLMYLNDVGKGGETTFPNVPDPTPKDNTWSDCAKGVLAVKPRKGDALLFFSMHPDGTPDEGSLHHACPVEEGVKWSAPKWIHVRSFDVAAAADEDGAACKDLNGLCASWAATGECQKNPGYMVGDSGSVGACRKSCGACKPES